MKNLPRAQDVLIGMICTHGAPLHVKGAILYELEQKGNKHLPFGVASAAAMAYPAPPFMINGSAFERTTPMTSWDQPSHQPTRFRPPSFGGGTNPSRSSAINCTRRHDHPQRRTAHAGSAIDATQFITFAMRDDDARRQSLFFELPVGRLVGPAVGRIFALCPQHSATRQPDRNAAGHT